VTKETKSMLFQSVEFRTMRRRYLMTMEPSQAAVGMWQSWHKACGESHRFARVSRREINHFWRNIHFLREIRENPFQDCEFIVLCDLVSSLMRQNQTCGPWCSILIFNSFYLLLEYGHHEW